MCVLTSKSASQTKSGKVFNWFKFVCERPGEKVCYALWRYKYASAHFYFFVRKIIQPLDLNIYTR